MRSVATCRSLSSVPSPRQIARIAEEAGIIADLHIGAATQQHENLTLLHDGSSTFGDKLFTTVVAVPSSSGSESSPAAPVPVPPQLLSTGPIHVPNGKAATSVIATKRRLTQIDSALISPSTSLPLLGKISSCMSDQAAVEKAFGKQLSDESITPSCLVLLLLPTTSSSSSSVATMVCRV